MKRQLFYLTYLPVLLCFFATDCFSQQAAHQEDSRITKCRGDIIQYLIKQKNIDANFDIKDFDLKINVVKRLELYTAHPQLLIEFGLSSDHFHVFWGVISDAKRYFFYDPEDIQDLDVKAFEKECDSTTVAMVRLYYYLNPYEDPNFISKASWIFHQNLAIIKDAIYHKTGLTTAKVNSAVMFLKNITGIKSKFNAHMKYYHLTDEEYTLWLHWYIQNGSRLYWENRVKKVMIK